MPVINSKDKNGPYYKYGDTGHKYYYTVNDKRSRESAKAKAALQGRSIKVSLNLTSMK